MIRPAFAVACLVGALLGCAAPPPDPAEGGSLTVARRHGGPPNGDAARHVVDQHHPTELRPGDCIEPMPVDARVTVVSCSVPHAAEFATTYVVPEGPWPGLAEVSRLSTEGCEPRMRYVPSRRGEVEAVPLVPTEQGWPRYRTSYCLAVPVGGGKLVGRVIL